MSPPGPFCSSQPVPASQDRFHRTSVKRYGFHDPECLPSTGAPSGPACAGHGGARHRSRGVAVYEPASGVPLRPLLNFRQVPACAAPLRQFARKLHSLRPEAFAPNVRQIGTTACQLLQSLRFLSTTCGHDHHPASFAGGCPPALLSCGQRRVFRRVAGRAIVGSGAVVSFTAPTAPPSAEAWELCPDLDQPGHLMSRTRVHAGRRSQTQSLWDVVPTSSPADNARPSAPGLHFPTFREEDQDLRTRGAFPSWAAPKGWLGHSTDCHQPVD